MILFASPSIDVIVSPLYGKNRIRALNVLEQRSEDDSKALLHAKLES